MRIERYESSYWQTSTLLIIEDDSAVVVDPGITPDEVRVVHDSAAALGVNVSDVLITHADWDHLCGVAAYPNAVVRASEAAATRITSGETLAALREADCRYRISLVGPPRIDWAFQPPTEIVAGPFRIESVPLPGHSDDSVGYRIRGDLDMLIVGDYLSPAESPSVFSSTAQYRATLEALLDILRRDPPTVVLPGHGSALEVSDAIAVGEADRDYLYTLREAVIDGGRSIGAAVPLPRATDEDPEALAALNVEAQVKELQHTVWSAC